MSTSNGGDGGGGDTPAVMIGTEIIVAGVIFFFMLVAFLFFFYFLIIGNRRRRGLYGGATPATGIDPTVNSSSGLDDAVIQSIPIVTFRSSEGVECAVCLSEMREGEKARLLPQCKHGFHLVCIDVWLRSHSTCPLCRTAVTGEATTAAFGDSRSDDQVIEIEIEIPRRRGVDQLQEGTPMEVMNNKSPRSSSGLRSLIRLWSHGRRSAVPLGVGVDVRPSSSSQGEANVDQGMTEGGDQEEDGAAAHC
ncbi:hypothetical protein J5N97_002100 [Dioscorea zingiberensis]|uniref:RING-type E3 ubiquitin transferase n=1 Tax=Dioscorea zingiberensis TaxID=325984 RepID=A0A9D5D339_9LILI|nr:hypothetical protein J5N97_002100 [Dioscorea zingiberensis]